MWRRIKHIYHKHAQLPTVTKIDGGYRLFFSIRTDSKSHISYIEVNDELELTYECHKPVLSPGPRGCFDDSGVMPSCLLMNTLYYTGWNTNKGQVPYGHGIGVAHWDEPSKKFIRMFDGPILDRGPLVPFLANSPCVDRVEDKYTMYFCNGTGWDGNFPMYNISSCSDNDPLFPEKKQIVKVVGNPDEACSRPAINDGKLFFAKKTKQTPYEIFSYSESVLHKELSTAEIGWDSEMVCYPYFCDQYMFYNGNGYGKTGIGVASCIEK